jgi:hypothetical protein
MGAGLHYGLLGKQFLVKNVMDSTLSSPVTDPSAVSLDVPVLINPY